VGGDSASPSLPCPRALYSDLSGAPGVSDSFRNSAGLRATIWLKNRTRALATAYGDAAVVLATERAAMRAELARVLATSNVVPLSA
jgi:hypothetical protein